MIVEIDNVKCGQNQMSSRIEFGPVKQYMMILLIGHIGRDFSNVVSVQLISAIIPRFSIDGDCIDLYPYY